METLTGLQKEVLMYFREAMNHNRQRHVKASEAAVNIDEPLEKVLEACEQLDQMDLLDIERRNMAGKTVKDIEAHISNKGIQTLQKEKGTAL